MALRVACALGRSPLALCPLGPLRWGRGRWGAGILVGWGLGEGVKAQLQSRLVP